MIHYICVKSLTLTPLLTLGFWVNMQGIKLDIAEFRYVHLHGLALAEINRSR